MEDNIKRNYFSIVKLIYMLAFIVYIILMSNDDIKLMSMELLLLSCILAIIEICEMLYYKYKALLFLEVVLLIFSIKYCGSVFIMLIPLISLEVITSLKLSFKFYFIAYIGLLFTEGNNCLYFFVSSFTMIIYFQNYYIIDRYKKYIEDYENKEYELKESIDSKELLFENKILEEKSMLYQSLHDKLGHSINGSLYQLEACKVLIDKDKEKSIKIIQGVIDALRESMNEIRMMLRKERPDKKRMALLQLMNLCDECKKKYGIEAEVRMEGDNSGVSEELWEVILDNSFEAVSNALKYSKCDEIKINISILNKLLRCSIKDNGVGCEDIKEGMGLQGMKNRVRKVKGVINVESNNGFLINMILPLDEGGRSWRKR